MGDPFKQYFESDVLGARDFAMLYGIDVDAYLRISHFDMRDCRDVNHPGQKTAKPVIVFVEHPGKPMFLSKTKFQSLLLRFGFDYWTYENREKILYAPIRLIAGRENIGGRPGIVVQIWEGEYPDHRAKIGRDDASLLGAMLKEKGITLDRQKLRNFVAHEHQDILYILDAVEGLADLPWIFKDVIDEYIREIEADLTPKPNTNTTMTHDDIPF